MLVGDPHNIPLWVRILGLFYDCHLTWNQHVNQIEKRVKQKLYQLQRITYCKRFNLSPRVTWKLYLSTIRPIIEYGLAIYGTNRNIQQLEKLQNKALRIAFKAKKSTNILYLHHFFQVQSLQQRMDIIRVKFWSKIVRSYPEQLTHKSLINWRAITSLPQNQFQIPFTRSQDHPPAPRVNFSKIKYLAQAPLSKAYQTIHKIIDSGTTIPTIFTPQYFRAPPCYTTQFPMKFEMYDSLEGYEMEYSEDDMYNQLQCWTDGSCKPNPGPGGASAYFPEMDNISSNTYFTFETTINHAEIVAIKIAFEQILANIDQIHNDYKCITIFTDSLFCYNLFTGDSYPSLKLYYNELIKIFNIINQLKNKYHIIFVKVSSHTNIEENDEVDTRAKDAAETAIKLQENGNNSECNWEPRKTPAIVDIQHYVSAIKQQYQLQQQKQFEELFKQLHDQSMEMRNKRWKKYLLIDALFDIDGKFKQNVSKLFKHELNELNGYQIEIITKLRTEHIGLFGYCEYILGHPSGICPECLVTETVEHYICDCPVFEKQRIQMRKELAKMEIQFDGDPFFNIYNILFPHLWVMLPDPGDEQYKQLWNIATRRRAAALRIVSNFVSSSQRFYNKECI